MEYFKNFVTSVEDISRILLQMHLELLVLQLKVFVEFPIIFNTTASRKSIHVASDIVHSYCCHPLRSRIKNNLAVPCHTEPGSSMVVPKTIGAYSLYNPIRIIILQKYSYNISKFLYVLDG